MGPVGIVLAKSVGMSRIGKVLKAPFKCLVPARLDRLPWTLFHTKILIALGVTWILDGLEVTMTGSISGALQSPSSLGFSGAEIGLLGSAYVSGAVLGALLFGYLTDVLGRKKLFFVTLAIYILGVFLSAFSWNIWSFLVFRFLTGAGIGGEYSAINSAIDELIPARVRGRVGLGLNGTYWIGAALGSLSSLWLLDPQLFAVDRGWRIGFGIGAVLGLGIIFFRSFVPESPRWLMLRGRRSDAEKIVTEMETHIREEIHSQLPKVDESKAIMIVPKGPSKIGEIVETMFGPYRSRSILGLTLMTSQAFLYNAIFFTYALVLTKFFQVAPDKTGVYILPFAVGNFAGPLLLGPLFDSVGRKKMISSTYAVSGVLLAITGMLFAQQVLTATTLTLLWSVIFFFASAAASSAYVTVSEIFPLETRAVAIAIFYALGTGIGGIVAPWIFGKLADSGSPASIMWGYLFAAVLMLVAAAVELIIGIETAGRSLEDIAIPLGAEIEDQAKVVALVE